jgi:serine/threonine protein kinase
MSDELIGTSLGQYQIRVLLGRGGMSTVYLAYQPSMDRTVAVKVLPREFLHDKTFLARFEQEGRTIAKLEHLHILPVYDVGEHDGIPYIVMRYLAGGTLADLILGRLPPIATTVRLIGQVADALDYAHSNGIIHRDLKPSNVLLDNSSNAYLADFGIARVSQAAQMSSLTGSRVIGTPPYIAPEMVKKDQKITASVDIYALGIITFEMLTGRAPFHDEDSMKVLMAHVLEPVPSMRNVDPHINPDIDAVVMRCLAKTPQQRYKTATDFAAELARAATAAQQARPAATTTPAQPNNPPPRPYTQAQPPPAPVYAPPPAYPSGRGSRQEHSSGRIWLLALAAAGMLFVATVIIGLIILSKSTSGLIGLFVPPAGDPTPTVTPTMSASNPQTLAEATVLPAPSSGGRLVFSSNRDGDYDLYLIDSDGENLEQVTNAPGADFDPAWSPDGTQIAYVSMATGNPEIMVIDISCLLSTGDCDKSARQLTAIDSREVGPAWSPDGKQIAFASDRDGDYDIYTMTTDGQNLHQLTYNDKDDSSPSWSPDGTQIVYSVENDGLYVINVVTGDVPHPLSASIGTGLWPDWSPTGTSIAFTTADGQASGKYAIFSFNLTTNLLTQLTFDSIDDDPSWSPDGSRLAFASDPDGDSKSDLMILDIARQVLDKLMTEADNVSPDWQPQSGD